MKIISIVNQKGGSGKTTTTILLARSLSFSGKKILVVDSDPQGGVSSIFGRGEIPHKDPRGGLYEIVCGADPVLGETVHKTTDSNIDLIPSDFKLDRVFFSISPYALGDSLKGISKKYDYVLIDTPPTVQGVTRSAIHFSNEIFVPCEISRQSFNPTRYSLQAIKENKKKGKVLFIGWKDPDGKKGFQADLYREFENEFKGNLLGYIGKSVSSVSFSSDFKKPSKSMIEKIINPILELIK